MTWRAGGFLIELDAPSRTSLLGKSGPSRHNLRAGALSISVSLAVRSPSVGAGIRDGALGTLPLSSQRTPGLLHSVPTSVRMFL